MKIEATQKEISELSKEFADKFSNKLRKAGYFNYYDCEDRVYQMLKHFLTKRSNIVESNHESSKED